MSQSVKELKQPADSAPAPKSLVGTTVAFVLYPDEPIPAVVEAANGSTIDYHYTHYERVKVDDESASASGLMESHFENRTRQVQGRNARYLDPCNQGEGRPPLPLPQSGHFTPGTWFDPSPFTFTVECYRDAQPEVRGISLIPGQPGPLRQAAKPADRQTLGPYSNFTEACEAFRTAKPKWNAVRMVFGKKGA